MENNFLLYKRELMRKIINNLEKDDRKLVFFVIQRYFKRLIRKNISYKRIKRKLMKRLDSEIDFFHCHNREVNFTYESLVKD